MINATYLGKNTGEANDKRAECSGLAGKEAETPLVLRLPGDCAAILMFQQPGGVMNAGRRGREWRWPHCPGAISGIGQPLATSQSPGWVSLSSIHITIHNSGASPDN